MEWLSLPILQDKLQKAFRRFGWKLFFPDVRGATAVEYAMMLLFITVAIVLVVLAVGQTVSNMFNSALRGFQ
jgi:Flp pilus assembly pilin Flp